MSDKELQLRLVRMLVGSRGAGSAPESPQSPSRWLTLQSCFCSVAVECQCGHAVAKLHKYQLVACDTGQFR